MRTIVLALAALSTTTAHAAPYCLRLKSEVLVYTKHKAHIKGETFTALARCTASAPKYLRLPAGKLCEGETLYGWRRDHPFACRFFSLRRAK